MFEYDNDYDDLTDIVTELNGGRVLPLIEDDFNTNEEE